MVGASPEDQSGQVQPDGSVALFLAAHQQMGLDLAWILPETSPTIVSHCALDVDRRSKRKVYKSNGPLMDQGRRNRSNQVLK